MKKEGMWSGFIGWIGNFVMGTIVASMFIAGLFSDRGGIITHSDARPGTPYYYSQEGYKWAEENNVLEEKDCYSHIKNKNILKGCILYVEELN